MHIQPDLEAVVDSGPKISSLRPGHPGLQVLPIRTDTGSDYLGVPKEEERIKERRTYHSLIAVIPPRKKCSLRTTLKNF